MTLLTALPAYVVTFVDQVPKDEDVKAGWLAFGIFIALILAVAVLGRSLVTQLRKAKAAEEAGLYDPSEPRRAPQRPTIPIVDPQDRPDGRSTERPSDPA